MFICGKLKNVEGWRQSKCAGLVLLGSVSCEACRVNPVAPQGMTKNRSLGLWNVDSYSSCPLGVADIYASLFDKAAAALIRSEFRVRAMKAGAFHDNPLHPKYKRPDRPVYMNCARLG
jgi:hypothetical protein